jgi:MoaA/NifB/PqqE/SkfB family radical SAM enzyme
VSFILQPEARHERDRFLDKWRRIGVDAVTFYVLTEHDPNTGEMIRQHELCEKGDRYPCASPWLQSVVFPDGEVSLCCKTLLVVGWMGVIAVGNVHQEPFENIWQDKPYATARKELLAGHFNQFGVCRNCSIWSASTTHREVGNKYIRTYNETMETYAFVD